jgi:hypothetical protein
MDTSVGNSAMDTSNQELMFALDKGANQIVEEPWYQNNDVVFPLLLIGIGLFQFVLRKWIAPVSEEITSKLENQLPTQGLIYMPEFGAVIAIIGVVLLVVLNILLPLAGFEPL